MKQLSAILIFLMFSCLTCKVEAGGAYCPDHPIFIESELGSRDDSQRGETASWIVKASSFSDKGGCELSFYLADISKASPICRIILDKDDGRRIAKIEFYKGDMEKPRLFQEIMVLPGFPAPCSILPISEASEGRFFTQKDMAGNAVFVHTYEISHNEVSLDQAVRQGWIRCDVDSTTPSLELVEVRDRDGRLILRQLWTHDDDWWLYEERFGRRSWRVSR